MKKLIVLTCCVVICLISFGQKRNEIIVAKDGSGNFTTVQGAFDKIPSDNKLPVTIFIRKGIYKEKLHLTKSKKLVTLIGEDAANTILTFDDHTGRVAPSGETIGTSTSFSFLINADDFTARNISFQNDAGYDAGQAVAVHINGDRVAFYNCRFLGNQDVLLTNNKDSRAYFKNCYIEGTTDFIFGAATAYFDHCSIYCKRDSHITAASTPQDHAFGYVFYDCKITGASNVTKADLGRPWRDYACVAFIHCYLGHVIKQEGWSNWHNTNRDKTARYFEYQSYGPGADPSGRVAWSHQLTAEQAKAYTIKNVFNNWTPTDK
ncbi:MAG TPA: pectinesterase family protein [Arachidicoccus soli]|nr:pectinesterase family protein [Arachidicoccus soli]